MDEIEKELIGKLGKEALEGRIASKIAEYHQLIPRQASIYLVSLEEFGPRVRAAAISQAKQSPSQSRLLVRLERVFQQRKFERGGKEACVQRAAISDQSGGGTLVCYDQACHALDAEAAAGDLIEASPVRWRNDEFHLAHGGKIAVVQKGARAKLSGSEGIGNFEGNVAEVFGDFPLKKNGGTGGMATSFSITDGKDVARVVCWEGGGIASRLHEGMGVIVENGVRRGGEIHVGAGGRLLVWGEEKQGEKIASIEISGENIDIATDGGQKITLGARAACEVFGLGSVPEGISPMTVVTLKKNDWVGRELPHDWKKRISG